MKALADDADELEALLDEHQNEDESAFEAQAEAFQAWKLNSLRAQNRMMFAVVLALVSALVSILVVLATSR